MHKKIYHTLKERKRIDKKAHYCRSTLMNNWRNHSCWCFQKVHEGPLNRPESPDLTMWDFGLMCNAAWSKNTKWGNIFWKTCASSIQQSSTDVFLHIEASPVVFLFIWHPTLRYISLFVKLCIKQHSPPQSLRTIFWLSLVSWSSLCRELFFFSGAPRSL